MTTQQAKERLDYLREELRAERISYGEILELQSLIPFIDKDDVELLEAAGVPEFPESDTVSVQIPFDGFYESYAMHAIDSVIESDLEHLEENGHAIDSTLCSVDFQKFAQLYVDLYQKWLEDEELIRGINLEFDELVSPRFYNYGTDRIYCKVSKNDLWRLYTRFTRFSRAEESQQLIENRFKSRPGFASFYDDFVNEWKEKPLDQWDENELAILFPDPFNTDKAAYFYDDANCNGSVSECIIWPEHVNQLF